MTAPEIVSRSVWEGFERTDFTLAGRPGHIIHPESPLPGNPWVWRAEFFGAFAALAVIFVLIFDLLCNTVAGIGLRIQPDRYQNIQGLLLHR